MKELDLKKITLSEQEVNLLMRRINDRKIKPSDVYRIKNGTGYKLTQAQNNKGYRFLMNAWKTPRGVERTNNPFGYREWTILEKFREIKLIDVYSPRGNYYYPYYRVYAKDGDSFEYVYYAGQIHILG